MTRDYDVHLPFRPACENWVVPRLNAAEYMARRDHLRADWLEGAPHFRRLTSKQQWALHDFYFLSHDLPDTEVITRRKAAVKAQPGLMKAAEFAYRSFAALTPRVRVHAEVETVEARADRKISVSSGGRSMLRVWVKPDQQTDKQRLAEALLLHAQQKAAGYVRPARQPGVYRSPKESSGD